MSNQHSVVDPWELQLFLVALQDWVFTHQGYLHKSWEFCTSQQAQRWHARAQALSDESARNCLFYLDHISSGRIETDMINQRDGHLTRADLAVAILLNALETEIKMESIDG